MFPKQSNWILSNFKHKTLPEKSEMKEFFILQQVQRNLLCRYFIMIKSPQSDYNVVYNQIITKHRKVNGLRNNGTNQTSPKQVLQHKFRLKITFTIYLSNAYTNWKIEEYSRGNYNLKGCLKKKSFLFNKGNLTTFFKTFFVKLSSMEIRTDNDNGNQHNNFLFIELVFIRNLWENAVSKEIAYEEYEPTTRLKIVVLQFELESIY